MFQLTWKNKTAWRAAAQDDQLEKSPTVDNVAQLGWLDWEEHCVECSAPSCYATCQLFKQRKDQRCARFAYGIFPNPQTSGQLNYGADITFRPWAKLEAAWPARPKLRSIRAYRLTERVLRVTDWCADRLADISMLFSKRRRANAANTWLRRTLAAKFSESLAGVSDAQNDFGAKQQSGPATPDCLLMVVWSPHSQPIDLQLEVITDRPGFRHGMSLETGWNRIEIPYADIAKTTDARAGRILLWMNNQSDVRLIFSWLGLVRFAPQSADFIQVSAAHEADFIPASATDRAKVLSAENVRQTTGDEVTQDPTPAAAVKCVAWDLDNTLWDGVIGDDGADNVAVDPRALELIAALDERGVLQTIVSKNTHDVAWKKIEELKLDHYFLYPAIHWGPKSESLSAISKQLNINIDTFAVIDDNPFERREIVARFPQVRTYDPATDLNDLLQRSEFNFSVSAESRNRRAKYQAEAKRKRIQTAWHGEFDAFLATCNMVLHISTPTQNEIPRCLELIQRSNQFNLSTQRYSESEFLALLDDSSCECFALRVDDDFGSYGIVGFCAFRAERNTQTDELEHTLIDFVLSCRVAQKRIEDAFLKWYARHLYARKSVRLFARLRVTDRNQPLRNELTRVGFVKHRADSDSNARADTDSSEQHLVWNFGTAATNQADGQDACPGSIRDPNIIQIDATHPSRSNIPFDLPGLPRITKSAA